MVVRVANAQREVSVETARIARLARRAIRRLRIRTPGTLASRCLWIQTHRAAGYVTVGLGLVFALSGAFLSQPAFERVMGSAMLAAVALLVVSYCAYAFRSRQPS